MVALHPIGYPMASTFAMRNMWFSTLVAWAIKTVILRYGGVKTYERSRSSFLGLILGISSASACGSWWSVHWVQDHFLYP